MDNKELIKKAIESKKGHMYLIQDFMWEQQ